MKRVVITGIGGWTCLANSFAGSWERLLGTTECPAQQIKDFDATSFPTTFACEAVTREDGKRPSIVTMAVEAAKEATSAAKLSPDQLRAAGAQWFLGLGMGTPDLEWFAEVVLKETYDPTCYNEQTYQMPARMGAEIAKSIAPELPVHVIHTACASSALAIGEAFLSLRSGEMEICLAGGSDAMVQPMQVAGLSLLGALSQRNESPEKASRPFTSERDGLVIGDGSCILVMETLESAQRRKVPVIAEITGYGCTESGYRITDLHPEGKGVREAMKSALKMSGIDAGDVNYINAHGTSTLPNDRIESDAISDIFPKTTRVSSTKGMVGHLIAAAGAIEAGFCAQSLASQTLPHSMFKMDQDAFCPVTLTNENPEKMTLDYVLSNSIGFGGSNAALVFKRGEIDA